MSKSPSQAESEAKFRAAVRNKPYRPPNGTEGMMFIDHYCGRCWHDRAMRADPDGCDGCKILADSFAYSIDDPNYPKQWVYDDKGYPTCTAFRLEQEGEPQDPNAVVRDLFALATSSGE